MKHLCLLVLFVWAGTATAQEERGDRTSKPVRVSRIDTVDFEGRAVVKGELLVKFREGNSRKLRGDGVRMSRYRVAESRDLGRSGFTHLKLTGARSLHETIADLTADADVEYVEPNYIVEASAMPNDPLFNRQWALRNTGQDGGISKADIDVTTAWEYTKGNRKNVIGVVDTGIDYTHPDLKDNIWSAPRQFTVTWSEGDSITCPAGSHGYNAINDNCDPKDNGTHGTMVAGAIGAAGNNSSGVAGVAWTTSMMGLAFLDSTGRGSVSNAIRVIEFALQARKALGDDAKIRVLNNSWGGGGYSQALLDEINKAGAAGMLFVAAAGNTPKNLDERPEYPAAYTAPNMISVAATDNKDGLATFSSYGAKAPQVAAPGVSIATTSPGGGWVLASGTSFAAPLASGIGALVLSRCDTLDTPGLRKAILESADPIPALAGKTATGGRVNAYKAVRSCVPAPQGAPGISITASTSSVTLNPGTSSTITLQAAGAGGFSGTLVLTAAGLPAGVTGSFSSPTVQTGQSVSLRLAAAATAPVLNGPVTVSVRAICGTLNSTAALMINLKPVPSFNVTASPASATIRAGSSTSFILTLTPVGDFNQNIAIQLAGIPAGASASFTQTSPGTLAIAMSTTPAVVPKSYTLTVTETSGPIVKTTNLTLTVTR